MRHSIVRGAGASLRCARAGLLAALVAAALWSCSDNRANSGSNGNAGPEILRVTGVVAVGDRVANARVRVVCGAHDPRRHIIRSVIANGMDVGDRAGSYEIAISNRDYIDECLRNGVRARADFRLESDVETDRKLFSGVGAVGGRAEQMTLNINPFTDIAVRMALTDTDLTADNAWMSAQPSTNQWRAVTANLKRIAELTGGSADFASGAFSQQMDDALERYRIEPLPDSNGVVFGLHMALPVGSSVGAPQPGNVVTLFAEGGVIRAPTRAEREAIARIQAAAARIPLEEYRRRIVDNLAQFDDEIAKRPETIEFVAISGVSGGAQRTVSLAELGLSPAQIATWRVRSVHGAGIRAFTIGNREVGLDIAHAAHGERYFKVEFDAEGSIAERFYTFLLLSDLERVPIEIDVTEQSEATVIPEIADPDGRIDGYALRGAPAFVAIDAASGVALQIAPDYGAVPTGDSKDYTFALVANRTDGDTITTPVVVSVANTPAPPDTQRAITDMIVGMEDIPRVLLRNELIETSRGAVWQIVGAAAKAGSALRIEHSNDRVTVTSPNTAGAQGFSVMFRADGGTPVAHDYVFEAQQRDDVRIAAVHRTVSSGTQTEIAIAVADPDGELTGGETASLRDNPDYARLDWPNRRLIVDSDRGVHETTRFFLTLDYAGQHVEGAITLTVNDSAPPTEVSGLTIVAGERSVTLNWNDPADADLASVWLEPTGSTAAVTVAAGQETYRFECLTAADTHMRVRTVDSRGAVSAGVLRPITFATDTSSARAGAAALTVGDATCGTIATEADRDWRTVHLIDGRLYQIDMNKLGGSRVDPIVRLFPIPHADTFIADNNGAAPGQSLSDARLYYRATRTGVHDIQVTTATADRDVNDVDYIGDYRLSVSEIESAPVSSAPTPLLAAGQTLTRDIADYELVWNEEFNGPTLDDNLWNHAPYFPGAASGTLRGNIDADGIRQPYTWTNNMPRALRLTIHDGLRVLRQAVTYPRYSGLRGQRGWNIDDDGNWIIPRPGGASISIADGYLPTISGTESRPLPDLGNIVGRTKGFWDSRINTRHKVHTRYGYYELYVRFKEFTNFQGFRFAWWIDGQNYWATSGNYDLSLKNSVFNGQEIDIAEVQSQSGRTKLKDWSVLHISSNPQSALLPSKGAQYQQQRRSCPLASHRRGVDADRYLLLSRWQEGCLRQQCLYRLQRQQKNAKFEHIRGRKCL